MDYEIKRCSRQCTTTGRPLEPGETYYSVLTVEGVNVVRYDYSVDAWQGPPEKAIGWWKSQMPERVNVRPQAAPSEVMLQMLDELAGDPSQQDLRYVLALLLVRRRILRLEESEIDQLGQEILVAYSAKFDATYRVPVVFPTQQRTQQIQDELARLLEIN